MQYQALVLLSGGLDSVYNLYAAHSKWPGQVQAIHFNYGQRAAEQERLAAQYFADNLQVPMDVLDLAPIFNSAQNALTQKSIALPTTEVDIESLEASHKSAAHVWVANRNGVLLNIAACRAESRQIPFVVPGFNIEEAQTFPDNSVEYINRLNSCFELSTGTKVQVKCFSQEMYKTEIIKACQDLNVNIDQIWSCYGEGQTPCGVCESCQRFSRAKKSLGL